MSKGVNGKAKGAAFERKIAKLLTDWISKDYPGVELRRTPLSGGWSRQNPAVAGDIVCITDNVYFPYSIELKCRENWKWESILSGESAEFDKWWEQCENACPAGKIPVVIFTKNYAHTWISFRYNYARGINEIMFEIPNYVLVNNKVILLLDKIVKGYTYKQFIDRSV